MSILERISGEDAGFSDPRINTSDIAIRRHLTEDFRHYNPIVDMKVISRDIYWGIIRAPAAHKPFMPSFVDRLLKEIAQASGADRDVSLIWDCASTRPRSSRV